jgi:hypothetical protein
LHLQIKTTRIFMSIQPSDQLYYFSGLIVGASETNKDLFMPALVLTLTTGALATSLRERLFTHKPGQSLIQKISHAISHTIVDALHLGSGTITGIILAAGSKQWLLKERNFAILTMIGGLGFTLASSCATVFARSLANKTNYSNLS